MCEEKLAFRLSAEIDKVPGGVTFVAKRLGKSRNTVYSWMAKGNIPAPLLSELADIGVDILYVMTGVRAVPQERDLTEREAALIGKYRGMSLPDQERFQKVVDAVAGACVEGEELSA
ncbi:MAG: hypothetical protein BECKG1743F_GA0114225_105865 [Candidatus Kentron sp. G]|nr:MAG: hypothetical protein BECKG1743F_GA0114225_105865 [Candidatus Kentron sp. G]VFN02663.1 MAG: hypothetical protein BECKG1743E_GA0114224_105305 [Candidatus Kentron sp. G]